MARTATESPIFEFGRFRLEPAERRLLREGQPLPLTPKAFDLLVYLVGHHGRLVEKHSLIQALWPDTVVEEANLANNVSGLRKLLDSGDDGSLIQTVPTRGYRFVAAVTVLQPSEHHHPTTEDGHEPVSQPRPPSSAVRRRITAEFGRHRKTGVAAALVVAGVLALAAWTSEIRVPAGRLGIFFVETQGNFRRQCDPGDCGASRPGDHVRTNLSGR